MTPEDEDSYDASRINEDSTVEYGMTETTATRLAAAINKQRAKVLETTHECWEACGEMDNKTIYRHEPCDAALTRLEKLCVAQGRWQQASLGARVRIGHEIEALLREET